MQWSRCLRRRYHPRRRRCVWRRFQFGVRGDLLSRRSGTLEFVAEVLKVFPADLQLQYFFDHRREVCQRPMMEEVVSPSCTAGPSSLYLGREQADYRGLAISNTPAGAVIGRIWASAKRTTSRQASDISSYGSGTGVGLGAVDPGYEKPRFTACMLSPPVFSATRLPGHNRDQSHDDPVFIHEEISLAGSSPIELDWRDCRSVRSVLSFFGLLMRSPARAFSGDLAMVIWGRRSNPCRSTRGLATRRVDR